MKNITKIFGTAALIGLMAFTASKPKLTVTSSAFTEGGMIPAKYSCEGPGISPPLTVTDIPKKAQSLAMIVHDPDAPRVGGVYHWVIWNLLVDGNIPEGFKSETQGMNSDNKTGYKAICPKSGTHHYDFIVYALDTTLTLPAATDYAKLEGIVQAHLVAQGQLTGLYAKSK